MKITIKRKRMSSTILCFILLVSILYTLTYFLIYKPLNTRLSSFNTIPIRNVDSISTGYTLIAPYNRVLTEDPKWTGKIYLLDLLGKAVHTWSSKQQTLYSVLKDNGNLLVTMESPKYSQFFPPGGNTGTIQELDWNSKVLWEYKNESMHHDLVPISNGNIAVALWEKIPVGIASQVQGGVIGTELQGVMWSDEVAEINKKGEKVWSWHSHEHMDTQIDILSPLIPRYAWSFINGMSYTDKNPIDGSPAYLLSMRSIDTVMFVRKSDGEIIWRSPKGMLSKQHDPTILENGNILVFDNGLERKPAPFPIYGSRVVEINPVTNKIIWQFEGGKNAIDRVRFFAPLTSGAQRLPNGNTLITNGPKGHIFEVTNKGEVVWDLVSPYTTQQTGPFSNNFLFKTRRYSDKDIVFPQNLPPPLSVFEYKTYRLLGKIYPAN